MRVSLMIEDVICRVIVAAITERFAYRPLIWELRPGARSLMPGIVHMLTIGTGSGRAGHHTLLSAREQCYARGRLEHLTKSQQEHRFQVRCMTRARRERSLCHAFRNADSLFMSVFP
jgi:hypothetical protein